MTANELTVELQNPRPGTHAALYSVIIHEIALKGKEARFVKTKLGRFATK